MQDWAPPTERFVEIPGIVDIKWVSDDPDYYVAPIDLFDEQKNGLSDEYGKKDKQTTEQSYFTCNICECDLKSVVTLRAHCKGTQHVKKALQKKKEYRAQVKKEAEASSSSVSAPKNFSNLFDCLEDTSEIVVGLEYITEVKSGNSRDDPMYYCSIKYCEDEQGSAEQIKSHMLSNKHKQGFLEIRTGSFIKHQTDIQQAIAQFSNMYQRDYRVMKEITDARMWRAIYDGRYRSQRDEEDSKDWRRVKKEYRDEHDDRWRRNRSRSPRRVKRERSRSPYDKKRDRNYDRDRHDDRERSRYSGRDSHRDNDRHEDRHERRYNDDRRFYRSPRVKEERNESEDDISEISRSGNFENWRTATVKVSRDDHDDERAMGQPSHNHSQSSQATANIMSTLEDDIKRLHQRVAKHVMDSMNMYYKGTDVFDPSLEKIATPEEYSRIARELSHDLRRKIKESYEAYHGCLDGIVLTSDHVATIQTEVERYFEGLPVI